MITKKDIITESQLQADIRSLPKDYNKGSSKVLAGIFSINKAERRKRDQQKKHGKARREKARQGRNAKPNGMAIANARLKYAITENKK